MKILPLRAETGRQTETTKLIIPFRNHAIAPKSRNTKVIAIIILLLLVDLI